MGKLRQISTEYRDYLAARDRSTLGLATQDLTWRGFFVGGLLSLFMATAVPYGDMVMRGTEMSSDFNTPGAIFLFLLLTGALNLLFKLFGDSVTAAVALSAIVTTAWIFA